LSDHAQRPVEVIYLTRRDSIEAVREMLENATPGAQVWLVAPWRHWLTRSLVHLKLLKRAAEGAALDLRLVSTHSETRTLARTAGIPVHWFVPPGLGRYRRQRREGAPELAARVVPVEGGVAPGWRRRPRNLGLGAALLSLGVCAGLVAVMLGVGLALVPTAKVTIEPVARPVSARFDVNANTTYREVAADKMIVPARVVQVIVEGRGETPASGRADVPDAQATGRVVFANKTNSPVVVPKGTIVRTGSGAVVRFTTTTAVELPGSLYASAAAGIVALDPGPVGNVQALTINVIEGEVATRVEVLNDGPTGGGTVKGVPVIDPADFDRLRGEMIAKLQQQAYEQFIAELAPGEFVPPESVEAQVMSQSFDQVAGERSDVLSMTMKVVVRGVAVDGNSVYELAISELEAQAEEGHGVIEDSLVLDRSNRVTVEQNGLRFSASARAMVAPEIDVERVKRGLRGKTVDEAQEHLAETLQLEAPPLVEVEPSGWKYLPWLPARLEVLISSEVS